MSRTKNQRSQHHRSDSDELLEGNLTMTGSDNQFFPVQGSSSYDDGLLPSLIGSVASSRASVVASLSDNFIHANSGNSKQKRLLTQTSASASSTSYADHCEWTAASIDAEGADTRQAITAARGGKKRSAGYTRNAPNPLGVPEHGSGGGDGGVVNPFAKAAQPNIPINGGKRTLKESGRKRSVCINAPPEAPRPPRNLLPPLNVDPAGSQTSYPMQQQQQQQFLAAMELQQQQQMQMQMKLQQEQIMCMQRLQPQQQQQYQWGVANVVVNARSGNHQYPTGRRASHLLSVTDAALEVAPPVRVEEQQVLNSNSTNEESSPPSPNAVIVASDNASKSAPTKKKGGFFLCGGKKDDVVDNKKRK